LSEAHIAKIRKIAPRSPAPALYFRFAAHGSDAPQRSPLLERLLARTSQCVALQDWRSDAFRVLSFEAASMPAVAPAALKGVSPEVSGKWVCIATPLDLRAGMTNVTLPANGIVRLRPAESGMLAADFNRVFTGAGVRMAVARGDVLLCVFDRALEVATVDPEAVAGRDVFAFQPAGSDSAVLRRLMSEIEMWLFGHEVNRLRADAALQPVSGLWLWGGGPTIPMLPAVHGWTSGQDPFFAAFGEVTQFPSESGSGVVVSTVYPGSDGWDAMQGRWLSPAVEALKRGRIKRLDLSAGDKRLSVGADWNLKFWRRKRPWWESFDMNVSSSNALQ